MKTVLFLGIFQFIPWLILSTLDPLISFCLFLRHICHFFTKERLIHRHTLSLSFEDTIWHIYFTTPSCPFMPFIAFTFLYAVWWTDKLVHFYSKDSFLHICSLDRLLSYGRLLKFYFMDKLYHFRWMTDSALMLPNVVFTIVKGKSFGLLFQKQTFAPLFLRQPFALVFHRQP